jgi:hypothetical protein
MKSHKRILAVLTLATSVTLPVAVAAQTAETTAPATVQTAETTAPATIEPAESTVPVTMSSGKAVSPGKAAMFSIIPGLSQHKMGNHGKAFIMEGAVAAGIVLVATSGSSSGSGDGGGSYTPPSSAPRFAAIEFSHGGTHGDGSGNGDGNGDGGDEGSSTARYVGAGLIVGGVAWSVIDAYMSAGRQSAKTGQASNVEAETDTRIGVNVVPSFSGVMASLAMRF